MDRRTFVIALLMVHACGGKEEPSKAGETAASRLPAASERARIPRIAVLYFGSGLAGGTEAFRQRLSELGYLDGKTVLVEERFADGDAQRLTDIARELAASKFDVIVTSAVAATAAARHATSTIPIVMVHAGNPVGAGLIASLARPGGNVTGTTNLPYGGKHVDLLRELVPRVARVAILVNPTNPGAAPTVDAASEAARKYDIDVAVAEVKRAEDFPSAFAKIRSAHADGLIVAIEPLIGTHGAEVRDFAAQARLPAIYDAGAMARQGGLIAYVTPFIEHYPLAAEYVAKILNGASPADLPVQQPTRVELVINMKAAKALGLKIPPPLLLRADEVIQ